MLNQESRMNLDISYISHSQISAGNNTQNLIYTPIISMFPKLYFSVNTNVSEELDDILLNVLSRRLFGTFT